MSGPPVLPQTSSVAMIRTLGLVATVCGMLIVSAYQGTLESVTKNRRIALERAVFKVIPGASRIQGYIASAAGVAPSEGAAPVGGVKFYAAYDAAGALKGIAAEAAAVGYADTVRVLYAYDPVRQVITGLGVVAHRETPGIGDRIITDRAFLANFTALDVRLAADLKGLAHAVKTVKHGTKQHPWEIDAISGATVTCKAVGKGINASAQRLLPLLVPNLETVKTLPRSLSDLRLIYCASGKSGPFLPAFSLHRPTMRLEIVQNCPRSPTRLATIAQVRQAPRS